jgi:hypothetical protein
MNKLPVYLYSNKLEVILDLDENKGIHKIMYQRKLKIQKGFKDSIQIQFKNSDQKPVSLTTSTTYRFDMIDSSGRQLVLSKPLTILDDHVSTSTKGLALATFDPIDTINLQATSYKFIVKKDNGDGTFTPAYSNTYYGITGEVEVVQDGFAVGYPIQTIDIRRLESTKEYDRTFGSMGYIFTTEWLRPVVQATTNATTSTAMITLASFAGEITVEGTLDNNPSPAGSANAQAFTVTNYISSTPAQGIIQLSWNGSFTAVRFKIKPTPNPMGVNYYPTGYPIGSQTNKYPSGFVDQIQYIS